MLSFLALAIGLALLISGGAALVRGASGIAASFGVSPMMVGLTVVAFGTSAPELVVNVLGALQNETALAFGNVVGSNIANLGLVLGLAGLVAPIAIASQLIRREVPLLLLATSVLLVMVLDGPLRGLPARLDRSESIILLMLFGIFLYIMIGDVIRQRRDPLLTSLAALSSPVAELDRVRSWWFVGAGVIGLAAGGQVTISAGVRLAEQLEVSKALIGMVVIAIGTSLPELVTSVIAAARREPDLSVGNIIGSNIFNTLLVLPISGLVSPILVPSGGTGDLAMSFLLAAALIPTFIIGRSLLGRRTAGGFLAAYVGYIGFRILSGGS